MPHHYPALLVLLPRCETSRTQSGMAQKRPARARPAHGALRGIEVRCAGGAVKPRLTRAEAAPGQWRRARRLLREEGAAWSERVGRGCAFAILDSGATGKSLAAQVVVLRQLLPKSSVQRARSRQDLVSCLLMRREGIGELCCSISCFWLGLLNQPCQSCMPQPLLRRH